MRSGQGREGGMVAAVVTITTTTTTKEGVGCVGVGVVGGCGFFFFNGVDEVMRRTNP